MAPLYGSKKNLVYDNKVLDKNSVGLPNSRALIWQQFDYNNSERTRYAATCDDTTRW